MEIAARIIEIAIFTENSGPYHHLVGSRGDGVTVYCNADEDHLHKGLSARWEAQRPQFEAGVSKVVPVPESAGAVAASFDGVMVPMKARPAKREGIQGGRPVLPPRRAPGHHRETGWQRRRPTTELSSGPEIFDMPVTEPPPTSSYYGVPGSLVDNTSFPAMYEEYRLAPGDTNVPFAHVDPQGNFIYPWHQYYADTDCLWVVWEMLPIGQSRIVVR